jgi:hypothetical protein
MLDAEALDRLAIRELIDQWVIYSDAGDWERFAALWHDDGWMSATWFQAPAAEFVQARKAGWDKGVSIIHFLGAHAADIRGVRAIAQTKMTISQRATVHDVLVDVVCTGRFYDFLEKRADDRGISRWGLVRRQPIYEKDVMTPVDPSATLKLDPEILARFPEGYKHLAYLQSSIGYDVKRSGLPELKGAAVERLYREGADWLDGTSTPGTPA